jgi:NAD+ kinase
VDADVALSLGGDGTFLTTVMWVVEQDIPIMGINMGHLGYLAAYSLDEAEQAVDDLLAGNYTIERRSMLRARCEGVEIEHPLALNDIAILRQDTSSMIEMETTLQGKPLTTYKGDGLVVCTPTGSTAYNLSAGGPILEPTTRCLVLSPLSPHSLTMRPLVVPDESVITIVTHTRADTYRLSVDGEGITCPAGTRVTIERAPLTVQVIQRTDNNFARTLRHKLHWGS